MFKRWSLGGMIAILVLPAAALQALPTYLPFAPAGPGPITIASDNVELDGAGKFDFEPQTSAFDVDPPAGGNGLSLMVRLWFGEDDKPVDCDIGQSDLVKAAEIRCAQLMASARFHKLLGMAAPFRRGFVDVQFSFFKDPPGGPSGRHVFANVYPGYANTTIAYPRDETPIEQKLTKADGRLVVPFSASDYPPIALRYSLQSRSAVLLGIARDGAVKSCRPISSEGLRTELLDNYTCTLALRRGRFEFLAEAPSYQGLRYRSVTMRWEIPGL
jgi:hypothetical protein